jgi:hypothetical protein
MNRDDAADAVYSRRCLVAKTVVAAAALGIGFEALADNPATAASRAQDATILNFLLRLERIEAAFFTRAAHAGSLTGELRQYAEVVAEHDEAHADALQSLLGADVERSRFKLRPAARGERAFMQAALTLKEATVAAYIGEAANLTVDRLTPVASIVSVEARHAAWIRSIGHALPAPRAADAAKAPKQVLRTIQRSAVA